MGWGFLILPALFILTHCTAPVTTTRDPRIQDQAAGVQLLEIPFFRQQNWTGCGAAVLASVLSYWDRDIRPEDIQKRFPADSPGRGYTLGELKKIARHYDCHAFAFACSLDTLKEHLAAGRPLIVPLEIDPAPPLLPDYDHYVIVVGLDRVRGRIYLADPQVGILRSGLSDFNRQWRAKSYAALLVAP